MPFIDYATDNAQRIAAYIREASLSKPETENLRSSGVEIRVGDVTDGVDKLKKDLEGVDVVISALVGPLVGQQRDLALAAKEVGVKRFIPSDWAIPGEKGRRVMGDWVRPRLFRECLDHIAMLIPTPAEIRSPRLHQGHRLAVYVYRDRLVHAALPPAPQAQQGVGDGQAVDAYGLWNRRCAQLGD